MRKNKLVKFLALNLGIVLANIIIFSEGFLNINIGGKSALASAFGITIILMSVVVFVRGNYRILVKKEKLLPPAEIKTAEDCIRALKQNYEKRTFTREVHLVEEQIDRFQKKKETINDILLQKFSNTEMSYQKFSETVINVENLFYLNIKSILNKINAFDEDDYNQIKRGSTQMNFSKEFIDEKMKVFNEYILFVKDAVENDEEILLKLDKMLLEISRFNSLEDGEIEDMSAMKEIDDLIKNAKWYK